MWKRKEKRKERMSLWFLEPLVVNTLILCVSLLGRGDRVIGLLPLVRGGELVVVCSLYCEVELGGCNPLR